MTEAYLVAFTRMAGGRKGGRLRGWRPAMCEGGWLTHVTIVERL